MSQQRTHTQTFTQGINQRIPPERTNGLIKTQNARLSSLGETAQVKRIEGYLSIGAELPIGLLVDQVLFDRFLVVLYKQDNNMYALQVRDLDTANYDLVGNAFTFTHTGPVPTLELLNTTVYLWQAGKMLNYINGQFYFNDDTIPKVPSTVSKIVRVDAADEIVNVDDTTITAPDIAPTADISGTNTTKTITFYWINTNKQRGVTAAGVPSSIDLMFRLEFEGGALPTQTAEVNHNTNNPTGSVSFTVSGMALNTSYRCRLVCYLRDFPEYSDVLNASIPAIRQSPELQLYPYGGPISDTEFELKVRAFGKVYYGTQVRVFMDVFNAVNMTTPIATRTATVTATDPGIVFKLRNGANPYLEFSQTNVFNILRHLGEFDVVVQTRIESVGYTGSEYEASGVNSVTIPAIPGSEQLEEFLI